MTDKKRGHGSTVTPNIRTSGSQQPRKTNLRAATELFGVLGFKPMFCSYCPERSTHQLTDAGNGAKMCRACRDNLAAV